MNGCKVTMKSTDGETVTQNVIITLDKGPSGGTIYANSNGFKAEILGAGNGISEVVDWGWPDGKRGYTLTNIWPIVIPM